MSAFLYFSIILLSPHAKVLQQICDYSGHPYAVQHGYYELWRNSGNTAHVFWFWKAQTFSASVYPTSSAFGPQASNVTEGYSENGVTMLEHWMGMVSVQGEDGECGWWHAPPWFVPCTGPRLGIPVPHFWPVSLGAALQGQPLAPFSMWNWGVASIKCHKYINTPCKNCSHRLLLPPNPIPSFFICLI